jgi:hypothetical protein
MLLFSGIMVFRPVGVISFLLSLAGCIWLLTIVKKKVALSSIIPTVFFIGIITIINTGFYAGPCDDYIGQERHNCMSRAIAAAKEENKKSGEEFKKISSED